MAASNIGVAASYGTIGAAISAGGSCPASPLPPDDPAYVASGVIDLVLAHGDIAGSMTADTEIHAVHAAGIIAAAISAPVIGSVVELDTALLADPAPTIDTGPIMAAVSAAQAELAAWRAQLQADAVQFHADLAAARTDTLAELTAVLADIAAEISAAQTDAAAGLSAALTDAVAAVDAARLAALDARNAAISESSARRAADAPELAARVTEGNAEHTLLTNAADAIRNQAQAQAAAKFDERVNVGIALSEQRARRDQAWIDAWNAIIVGVGDWLTQPGVDSTLDGIGDAFERLGGVWDRARGTGSGWLGAVYQVIGVGFYDLIGVTGIYNGISGEEIVTLEKLGPWERVTSFIDGSIRLATTVIGGTRAVGGVRAWRAGRCSWNPFGPTCFVAGTQVVIGEVVKESTASAQATGNSLWSALGLTFAIVGVGGVVLLENRQRRQQMAGQQSVDTAFSAEESTDWLDDGQSADFIGGKLPPHLPGPELDALCDRLFSVPQAVEEDVPIPGSASWSETEDTGGEVAGRAFPAGCTSPSALAVAPATCGARPVTTVSVERTVVRQRARRKPCAVRPSRRPAAWWLSACVLLAGVCFWLGNAPDGARPQSSRPQRTVRYVTKAIEDIRPGEEVLARDEFGRDVRPKRVLETYRRTSDHLRILTFRCPDGSEQVLKTTNEHPFWSENRRAWIEAGHLKVGDTFTGPRGERQTLAATLYDLHPDGISVFNFEVTDDHSYFVGEHENVPPVLVHNYDDMHHGIPRQRIKEASSKYGVDPAEIMGKRGQPNRLPIDHAEHMSAHNGGHNGGMPRYNDEFRDRLELIRLQNGAVTAQDYWDIGARLLWEYFGIP